MKLLRAHKFALELGKQLGAAARGYEAADSGELIAEQAMRSVMRIGG